MDIAAAARLSAVGEALANMRREEAAGFDVAPSESLGSYVRVKIRAMAGDTFAISRHTMDRAVIFLRDSSIAQADAVLQQVIDAATVRRLRGEAATITVDDIRVAIRTVTAL